MLFEKISNLKKWNSLSQENRLRIAKALELALPTLATAFIDPYFGQFKAQYEGENWKPICKFNIRRIYPLT